MPSSKLLTTSGATLYARCGSPKSASRIPFSSSLSTDFAMCQKPDGVWNVTFVRNKTVVPRYSATSQTATQLFTSPVPNMPDSTWWWKSKRPTASTASPRLQSQRYFKIFTEMSVKFLLFSCCKIDAAYNYLSLDGILSLAHAEKLESEATKNVRAIAKFHVTGGAVGGKRWESDILKS